MAFLTTLQISAILQWFVALGFGIFCIPAIWNLMKGKGILYVWGLPTYGEGPFERIGIHTTIPLLLGFFLVCILQAIAGVLLWQGLKSGAILALVLLPFGLLYWWGFALPVGPLCAIIWTILTVMNWSSLQ